MRLAAAVLLLGCGGGSGKHPDAAVIGGPCQTEADCSGATPYCEPSTGSCVECRFSSHCTGANKICEADTCRAAKSCTELITELPGLTSGEYTVDPGTGPLDVMCDLSTAGGGWTLVQRTVWSWNASQALHTSYAAWHDMTIGMPATGAYRLAGEHWPEVTSKGEMMVVHRVRTTAGGACQPLYYRETGGTLSVSATATTFTGLTGAAALADSTTLLTTDNDPAPASCVNMYDAVPWFYAGCCTTCPTFGGAYWTDEPHPMQSYTGTTADLFGNTEAQACAGQTVRVTDNGSPHRGDDSMEVYLR
jgi:hypothetical protein